MKQMKTSLTNLRENSPCIDGWKTVLKSVDKTKVDDVPLPLLDILASNGLTHALWALRGVEGHDDIIRSFVVKCVDKVKHLLVEEQTINALNVAELFANRNATVEELDRAHQGATAAMGRVAGRAAVAVNEQNNPQLSKALVGASYAAAAVTYAVSPDINRDAQACCFWVRNAYTATGGTVELIIEQQEKLFIDMCNS